MNKSYPVLFFILYLNLFRFLISENIYVDSFFPLDNNLEYKMVEYSILKSNDKLFVLNQPYDNNQVFNLLKSSNLITSNFINRYRITSVVIRSIFYKLDKFFWTFI